jgi:dihydroneopterin aldolase
VDVDVETASNEAETSDRLADTVDYAAVCATIVEVGSGPTFHLLEALGRAMVEALAARFPGAAFSLELRKLAPPHCVGRPEHAAVRLSRPAAVRG